LDILIKPEAKNAEALFRALVEFGAPLDGLTPFDLAEHGSFFRMDLQAAFIGIEDLILAKEAAGRP